MPQTFDLSVVAPDKSIVEEKAYSVEMPGSEGYFGVLIGHEPFITSLKPGLLEYLDSTNQRHHIYVGGGFAEVQANRVTVLADEAERAQDIDVSRAEQTLQLARQALHGEDSRLTTEEAVLELERAVQRLRVAKLPR